MASNIMFKRFLRQGLCRNFHIHSTMQFHRNRNFLHSYNPLFSPPFSVVAEITLLQERWTSHKVEALTRPKPSECQKPSLLRESPGTCMMNSHCSATARAALYFDSSVPAAAMAMATSTLTGTTTLRACSLF